MSAQDFLSRLDKVRRTSSETWVACCPAHDDRMPSLTVRECGDGRVLLHCFAGCSAVDVIAAVGMTMEDLFPAYAPLGDSLAPLRVKFPARDVLECVAQEALIAQICAAAMANGTHLPEPDRERLAVASKRLQEAVDVIRG